jgi:glycosyltransferase involved in cell wall biosynthesis
MTNRGAELAISEDGVATPRRCQIAVVLPCYNEALAIQQTVEAFRRVLPDAAIYVYDNNSTDGTAELARKVGAIVRSERTHGKGNVVRRAFADVDADVYVLADGDGTYEAGKAPDMVAQLLDHHLDMVVGVRIHEEQGAYRGGHVLGNRVFNEVVRRLFRSGINDVLSGYRIRSRRFVKSFPSMSSGFEVEVEMSVHALQLRMPMGELPTQYLKRLEGSTSKLRTYSDGSRILAYILRLLRLYRPQLFFGVVALLLSLSAILVAAPLLPVYLETGLVPRLPTAVLATGLMLLAAISLTLGLLLDAVAQVHIEQRRMAYLAHPPPG